MKTANPKPILCADLEYWIVKLVFGDGTEIFNLHGRPVHAPAADSPEWNQAMKQPGGIPADIVAADTAPVSFWMQPITLGRLIVRSKLRRICYQVQHRPTREISPIFDHPFDTSDPSRHVGGILFYGPLQLRPAEQVWPELTRKGYYGELPQFYT